MSRASKRVRRAAVCVCVVLLAGVSGRASAAVSDQMAPAAHSTPAIFMESEVRPDTVFVGAEAHYLIRVYRRVPVSDARLTWPRPAVGADVMALGDARASVARRRGLRYRVMQWRFAVTPTQAGELALPSPVFEALAEYPDQHTPVTVGAPVRRLRVRPPPVAADTPWLPAHRIELTESWSGSTDALRAGDVITRIITLRARGLRGQSLPPIRMAPLEGLSLYHDQPLVKTTGNHSGVHGMRQQRIVLVAEAAGTIDLPSVRLGWWDVRREQTVDATLPVRRLQVGSAEPATSHPAAVADEPRAQSSHIVLMMVIAALLVTLASWRWFNRDPRAQRLSAARAVVLNACRRNDAPEARRALLAWAAQAWPGSQPVLLHQIAPRLDSDQLAAALTDLDGSLYGRGAPAWSGRALARCVRHLSEQRIQPRNQAIDFLHGVVVAHRDP